MVRPADTRGAGSRLAQTTSTIRLVAARLGWSYALLWLFTSLLGRRLRFHVFVVFLHAFDQDPPDDDAHAGLESRVLTREDVTHFFDRDEGYGYSRAFAADALSRGDLCVGVLDGDSLLWYCWFARGPAPVFDGLEVIVDKPCLYGYNAYTQAAHRGRGLHIAGVNASSRIFGREGYRAVIAYIEAHNTAPLVAAARMGERIVGFVIVHRRAGGPRWFASRGCRQGGFRIRRSSKASGADMDAGDSGRHVKPCATPRVG